MASAAPETRAPALTEREAYIYILDVLLLAQRWQVLTRAPLACVGLEVVNALE